jgi:hypothetical protein
LEKTIGMLESACILIFVLEDVFFLEVVLGHQQQFMGHF